MRSLRYLMAVVVLVASAFAISVLAAPPAAAQIDDPIVSGSVTPETLPPPIEVEREIVARQPAERAAPVEVQGEVEVRGRSLVFTGGDVVALAAIAAVSIGLGVLFVARARRRSAPRSA